MNKKKKVLRFPEISTNMVDVSRGGAIELNQATLAKGIGALEGSINLGGANVSVYGTYLGDGPTAVEVDSKGSNIVPVVFVQTTAGRGGDFKMYTYVLRHGDTAQLESGSRGYISYARPNSPILLVPGTIDFIHIAFIDKRSLNGVQNASGIFNYLHEAVDSKSNNLHKALGGLKYAMYTLKRKGHKIIRNLLTIN